MTIRTVDYRSPGAGRQFERSLHETGFAVLKNHPIAAATLDRLYTGWKAFFNSGDKQNFLCDPENRDGSQQGFHPAELSETAVGAATKDLKEFYHVVPGHPLPPALAADILAYRASTFELGQQLAGWLQAHAPAEITANISEPFSAIICSSASLLRVLHYPPLSGGEEPGAVRAAAHEDINLLTVLPVAEQPGLQVRDKSGNWVDVASIRGEIVVNSGDMLKEMTAGYYPSTTHRVVNPAAAHGIDNVSRISIPMFLTPRLDVVLSDRYTSGSYLDERLQLLAR